MLNSKECGFVIVKSGVGLSCTTLNGDRKSQMLAAQTGQKLVVKTTDFQSCVDKLEPFEIGVQHVAELWHLAYIDGRYV